MLSRHVDSVGHHVSRILREERAQRGLSLISLADNAGLSRSMISFVEREIRNPSLETLLRICYVLKTDLGAVIQRATKAAASERP